MTQRTLTLTLTDAGRAALVNAAQKSLDVQFSAIALGSGTRALDVSATTLTNQQEQKAIFSASQIAPGQLRISALFDNDPAYSYPATELGLIGDGVLFGVWSMTDPTQALVIRTPGVPYTCSITVGYGQLPSQNVSVVIQPLDQASQLIVNDAISNAINAHLAAADPHPQYVSGTVDQTGKPAAWRAQAIANLGLPVSGLQTAGPLGGVNEANLVSNSSGEFGTAGWSGTAPFSSAADASGGTGFSLTNAAKLTNVTANYSSPRVKIGPINVTTSVDFANLATAGTVQISVAAFDVNGNALGAVGKPVAVANGAPLQRYSISGVAPQNTASVGLAINLTGVTAPANGIVCRRLKIERGAIATLYSAEADLYQVGSYKDFKVLTSAAVALDATAVGSVVYLNAAQAVVCTLPPLSSVPVGAVISINSGMQSFTTTLQAAGTDALYLLGKSGAVTLVLNSGDTAIAVSTGAAWNVMGGSLQLGQASAFGASFGQLGFQKLPSGLIVQWGAATTPGGTGLTLGPATSNFPIAFPRNCLFAVGSLAFGGTAAGWTGIAAWVSSFSATNISVSVCLPSSVTSSGVTVGWIAFGY